MRSRARFSDHTESKLIRSLERRLSRCQCCCAADLWVVSDTKLIRLQISLGFERRMLLDVTNNWFSLKASTGLFANREENSYFYFNPARYAQKGRAMNENESPDRDRLDCRTTKCEISDVKLLLKQGQLWMKCCHITHNCMQNRCFPCCFTSYEFKWCVISIRKAVLCAIVSSKQSPLLLSCHGGSHIGSHRNQPFSLSW